MTIVSDIQNRFLEKKMQDETTLIISDYQLTSAERFKHISSEMFLNGPCGAGSHNPLMVYITWESSWYNKAYGYDQPGWKNYS